MDELHEQTRQTLLALMAKRKVSHGQVALAGGMHKSTVTRLLTGERRLTVAHLQSFAVALGRSASSILRAAEKP